MKKILIFAGTTEGRELADILLDNGIACAVSVATAYGVECLSQRDGLEILSGRLGRDAMVSLMRGAASQGEAGGAAPDDAGSPYAAVVDATHPFATLASKEIRAAAEECALPYLRLARDTGAAPAAEAERACLGDLSGAGLDPESEAPVIYVGSVEEAASYLEGTKGPILLTTGSKELPVITSIISDLSRLYARVLPLKDSLEICESCGLKGRQIIAMQGPFSFDMNVAMLHQSGAAYLLTKETGSVGGFEDKLEAALAVGARAVVIRNPEAESVDRLTRDQVLGELESLLGIRITAGRADVSREALEGACAASGDERTASAGIILAGIGVGAAEQMTKAVAEAVANADIIFGAPRVLESVAGLRDAACPLIPYYQSDKILSYLREHPAFVRPVVAFSGDTGFYSGASSMLKSLREAGSPYPARILPGISAPVYFASRIGEPWQDMTLLSAHGRGCNIIGHVRTSAKSFLLVAGLESVRAIGRDLEAAESEGLLKDITVTYGYQLSYPEEKIGTCYPKELGELTDDGLYVLLIRNPHGDEASVTPGLPDETFLRDKVPMTKEEVRALSLCKLRPGRKAVIWDVGAGSGSVSVEAARLCPDGWVYAIEMKPLAVELIKKNQARLGASNMTVIEGAAPEALEALPAPTHVFVGGSGGNLGDILRVVLKKNPAARAVINTVTLETLSEAQSVLDELGFTGQEYTQVSVSKTEALGRYHLMKAQNPVFIIAANGPGKV